MDFSVFTSLTYTNTRTLFSGVAIDTWLISKAYIFRCINPGDINMTLCVPAPPTPVPPEGSVTICRGWSLVSGAAALGGVTNTSDKTRSQQITPLPSLHTVCRNTHLPISTLTHTHTHTRAHGQVADSKCADIAYSSSSIFNGVVAKSREAQHSGSNQAGLV